jgi:hypothetical protein
MPRCLANGKANTGTRIAALPPSNYVREIHADFNPATRRGAGPLIQTLTLVDVEDLAFDPSGTVMNWHAAICAALLAVGQHEYRIGQADVAMTQVGSRNARPKSY